MSRGSRTDLPSELGLAVFEGYELGCHVVDWFLNDIMGVRARGIQKYMLML